MSKRSVKARVCMTRLLSKLARLFAPRKVTPQQPPQPRPSTPLPYTPLTLNDWRAAGERVTYVQSLLADPMFRDLVGMLANVRPLHRGSMDPTTAAMLLGQRIGYDQVIATLLAAGTQIPATPAEIEADYGAKGTMEAWETEGTL